MQIRNMENVIQNQTQKNNNYEMMLYGNHRKSTQKLDSTYENKLNLKGNNLENDFYNFMKKTDNVKKSFKRKKNQSVCDLK